MSTKVILLNDCTILSLSNKVGFTRFFNFFIFIVAECASLQELLEHKTFLEELVFWTVAYEFPQKLVCLLLNMLPDQDYKESLTKAFVLHYSRISLMLERSTDPETLSNRVVHVSVQVQQQLEVFLKYCTKAIHIF